MAAFISGLSYISLNSAIWRAVSSICDGLAPDAFALSITCAV